MTTPKIEQCLNSIAYELKRRNDMLEICMLLDAAEKIKDAAQRTSDGNFYCKCCASAKRLLNTAIDKLELNNKGK